MHWTVTNIVSWGSLEYYQTLPHVLSSSTKPVGAMGRHIRHPRLSATFREPIREVVH